MKLTIPCINKINQSARDFLASIGSKKIVAFYGSMGVGKTTFIKALCNELGSIDLATSPSYTLVNEYLTKVGHTLYHFDFYRIKESYEALDFGFEEYIDSGNYCFIEWPEKIENLLPESTLKVKIKANSDQSRTIEIFV